MQRFRLLLIILICLTFSVAAHAQKPVDKEVSGTVVERKKYTLIVDDGKTKREIVIANVGEVTLKLSRPHFDFQKKLVSVMPNEKTPNKRKVFSFEGELFLRNTFAHEKQKKRIMASSTKRLNDYIISTKKPETKNLVDGRKNTLALSGVLTAAEEKRKYTLATDSAQHTILLGSGGRLAGRSVTEIESGDIVTIMVKISGEKLIAQRIEFQPAD